MHKSHWISEYTGLLLKVFLGVLLAPLALAGTLKSLDMDSAPGDRVEFRLQFDGAPPTVKGYAIEQPARIAIDLAHTTSTVPKYNEVGFGSAKSVTVIEAKDRTRMIINLDRPVGYSTRIEGNTLFVLVGESGNSTNVAQTTAPATVSPANPVQATDVVSKRVIATPGRSITSIDFQRGDQGEGNILVGLSSKSVTMDLEEVGGRLQLSFPGSALPVELRNRLDVIDYATPVTVIDAETIDGDARIVIEPQGDFDYLAWQTDDLLTISVKPLTKFEAEQRARMKLFIPVKSSL